MFALQWNFICPLKCERAHHAWWDSEEKLKGNRTMCEGRHVKELVNVSLKRSDVPTRSTDILASIKCFNRKCEIKIELVWSFASPHDFGLVLDFSIFLFTSQFTSEHISRLFIFSSNFGSLHCTEISSSWSERKRSIALDADEDSMAEDGWCWIRWRHCMSKKV